MSPVARRAEYGDFQTPYNLAEKVCALLRTLDVKPRTIIEPTCGTGSFLRAAVNAFPHCKQVLGFDINKEYVEHASEVAGVTVQQEDFFEKDWVGLIKAAESPVFVIGNPPWVTNAALGTLQSANLPVKKNLYGYRGIEAVTGKGNFDISEWMIIHLMESLRGKQAVIAMLCKTAVARKALRYAWARGLEVARSATYGIDAGLHFGAAVDACLLVCVFEPQGVGGTCSVYPSLEADEPEAVMGFQEGRIVADMKALERYGHLRGTSPMKWRSGVKHDCARVMELRAVGHGRFANGLGESVEVETDRLYPLLKGSDVARGDKAAGRYVLVTQRSVGEETEPLRVESPRTWAYLEAHAEMLEGRKSSIYRNRPKFSIFGVGPYSFAPWKVAIAGFYKQLQFRCIGPADGKPVLLDDTSYFLPCATEEDARTLADLLNSEEARGFFEAWIFWDSKRPITAEVLGTLDLGLLAEEVGVVLPVSSEAPQQVLPLNL